MGCSASVSTQGERSISHFAQVVPAGEVRREAFPPPHVNGRKSTPFHKTAAKGGKQPVPAAWQGGEARAKDDSLKLKDPVPTLAMRTSTPGSAEESPELRSFNAATVVPEPSGLQFFSSFKRSLGKAEQEAGHPLAPCSPTHKDWMKRLNQTRADWEKSPWQLVVGINSRREDLDENMAAQERRSCRNLNVAKAGSFQPSESWQ
ncbi:unnamed protein product [Polarella glacialis]|uniref:Uncharacterized protein n=1 Tax=Polarella glacialis TaxID=89957 RepID=A0A813D939_POLGL|nr:unnamed protein product [Polarella glacialis]